MTQPILPHARRPSPRLRAAQAYYRPPNASTVARACDGTHKLTRQVLLERHFDFAAIDDVVAVTQSLGGQFDCEVLYNVAQEAREGPLLERGGLSP
jgi:hypothetical protein